MTPVAEIVDALKRIERERRGVISAAEEKYAVERDALLAQFRELGNSDDTAREPAIGDLLRPNRAQKDFGLSKPILKRLRIKHPELFFQSEGVYLVRQARMRAHLQLNPVRRRVAKAT